MKVEIKLTNEASMPTRAHTWDAGMDLRSLTTGLVPPGDMRVVDTGVSIKIPLGYVGLVFSRSGMGKSSVTLANSVGVIDESYRGNIKVMIKNNSKDTYFEYNAGDRICQLVIVPIIVPDLLVYTGPDDLWNATSRGTSGFGSSGKQ